MKSVTVSPSFISDIGKLYLSLLLGQLDQRFLNFMTLFPFPVLSCLFILLPKRQKVGRILLLDFDHVVLSRFSASCLQVWRVGCKVQLLVLTFFFAFVSCAIRPVLALPTTLCTTEVLCLWDGWPPENTSLPHSNHIGAVKLPFPMVMHKCRICPTGGQTEVWLEGSPAVSLKG